MATSSDIVFGKIKENFPYIEQSDRLRTWIADFVNREKDKAFKGMSLEQYTDYIADYVLDPKRIESFPEVMNPINSMVSNMFTDILGKEGSPASVAAWQKKMLDGVKSGQPFNTVSSNLITEFRDSPAYAAAGGAGGEWVRTVMRNIDAGINELPPFVWGDEEMDNARAFAEDVYGTAPKREEDESDEDYEARLQDYIDTREDEGKSVYFADLMMQQIENARINSTRSDEDLANSIANINRQLQNYTAGSEIQRARIEEDYNVGMAETARQLGITVEDIRKNQTRITEDKNRRVAELQEDFEKTGGRISADKERELGQLLQDKERTEGRLKEDESLMLDRLEEQYGEQLEGLTEEIESRGLTYSGQRTKDERKLERQRLAQEQAIVTQTGRSLEELGISSERRQEELERIAGRQVEDLTTQYERESAGQMQSYERSLEDLTRNEALVTEQARLDQERLAREQEHGTTDIAHGLTVQQGDVAAQLSAEQLQAQREQEDLARQLEEQQKALLAQQEEQVEGGYFGTIQAEDAAHTEYLDQLAAQEEEKSQLTALQIQANQINQAAGQDTSNQYEFNPNQ